MTQKNLSVCLLVGILAILKLKEKIKKVLTNNKNNDIINT